MAPQISGSGTSEMTSDDRGVRRMAYDTKDPEFTDEDEGALDEQAVQDFGQAVLHSSDWTVETIISQLTRNNIEMNPKVQRRDAWNPKRNSLFIESLILGLPIPQLVLAEKRDQRGRYLVLDGKQRLLSLLQFTGQAVGRHNEFRLSGLEARMDLNRKKFSNFQSDIALQDDLSPTSRYRMTLMHC
jgi:hypothetical protein